MKPPVVAQGILAAAAPTSEYQIIAGDLHEEYLRVVSSSGTKAANRWYWSQILLSIPWLISYSRSKRSTLRRTSVALISLAVLFAMLLVTTLIGMVLRSLFGGIDRIPEYVWICVDYADAVAFGAVLARLVRTDGLRAAFFASLFLVLCFVIPALAGNPHSQAPLSAWIVLWGTIPTMCLGAGLYQAAIHRTKSSD
jgi:hypothetical protein